MSRTVAELLQIQFNFPLSSKPIRKIALRGGGAKGVVYPGAIEALHEEGILDNVDTIGGSSAGALTAAMIAIGMTPEEIKLEVNKTDFNQYKDYHISGLFAKRGLCKGEALLNDIQRVIKTYLPDKIKSAESVLALGIMNVLTKIEKDLETRIKTIEDSTPLWEMLLDGNEDCSKKKEETDKERELIRGVLEQLQRLRETPYPDNFTKFKEISKYFFDNYKFFKRYARSDFFFIRKLLIQYENIEEIDINSVRFIDLFSLNEVLGNEVKHLVITGTNIDTGKLELFSYETTPNMPISVAARISASYPIVFQAVEYNGHRYIDGGVLDNLPVRQLAKQKKDIPLLKREQERIAETIAFELNPQKTDQGILATVTGFFTTIKNFVKYLACAKIDVATSNEELKQALMDDISRNRIDLPVDISTLDFKLDPNKKKLLQDQAKSTTKQRIKEILDERKEKSINCDFLRYLLEASFDDIEKNFPPFIDSLSDEGEREKVKALKYWVGNFRKQEEYLLSTLVTGIKGVNAAIVHELTSTQRQFHIDEFVIALDQLILQKTYLDSELVTFNESHKAFLYQKVKDIFSSELEELVDHILQNPSLKQEIIERLRQSPAQKEHAQFFDRLHFDLIKKRAIQTLVQAKAKPFQFASNVELIQKTIVNLRLASTEEEVKSALEEVRDNYQSRNVISLVQGPNTRFKGLSHTTTSGLMDEYIKQIEDLKEYPLSQEVSNSAEPKALS
ncbi:patatin-like phospholipase family protein [Legionella micdadei]|uniref:Patatin-like phospholipase n=1 Tax=Legionella micdadei TaxID=451 RepID=A0A098GGF1_LEGMI|nr:patatin-like phospholipase family protein [Legionella micdadei]ARG97457.1 hypothetical protein B6N58_07140 [Legionella micdadei]ARH00234.1 hypothetical protein B6V88_07280 [Legionella micdadei]KTD28350.1 esterase of the alpha-beta hydrolase superfamily protein [Legionella micdadei]NSL16978.1 patatin-like phospholipase family protein [Legionella micdadei]CEG61060.1 protein of unknown function [Legionella micdadei]